MSEDTVTVVIFEGIASINVEGVAHDVYLTARTEHHGYAVRWFGHFGWMGDQPKTFKPGGFFDLYLSDGREAVIRVPHFSGEEDGKLDFLGQGLPPGFEMFTPELVTAEIRSTTPSKVPSVAAFFLALIACDLFIMGIWSEDDMWRYVASGLLMSFVSMCFASYAAARKGRPMKEIQGDDSRS